MIEKRVDVRTLCALAAMAFVAACFAHEVLGHGASCLATGGTVTSLSSVYFRCSEGRPIVDASGPGMNLAVALAAALLLERVQKPAARTFLALLVAFNGFWGAGYFLFSGATNAGDWAFVLRDLSLEPRWLWRAAMVVAGAWLYGATIRAAAPVLPQGRPLAAAYLTAGAVACGSVVLYAGPRAPALLEAAKESLLASVGLLYIAFARERSPSSLPEVLPQSTRVQVLGLGVVLVFCLTQGRGYRHDAPRILLFGGTGTSPGDVTAVKAVLRRRRLDYASVNSSQLNGMSESRLRAYRLMIVPGGNFIAIGQGLTPATAANIHAAVQGGLNYLGICAGGLLAGNVPDNGLNLAEGARFGFYALADKGVHKSAVQITGADGRAIEHYWEDGPQYTGWGAVVAKYPDGTPAVVEGRSGRGWVLLVGTHPEAPETWRRGMTFKTPADAANVYAGVLIDAALNGITLPHD